MKNLKTRVAAAATIVGLGGLTGIALNAGAQKSPPVAAKPLVRTKVIRRTVHVTKHAKPKQPVGAGTAGAARVGAGIDGNPSHPLLLSGSGDDFLERCAGGRPGPCRRLQPGPGLVTHTSGSTATSGGGSHSTSGGRTATALRSSPTPAAPHTASGGGSPHSISGWRRPHRPGRHPHQRPKRRLQRRAVAQPRW